MTGDLKGVLVAMKNIAMMETKKVARFIENEHRSIEVLNQVAADFFSFHPPLQTTDTQTVFLALGSERGFCGDFNESVISSLLTQMKLSGVRDPIVLTVGNRLATKARSLLPCIEQIEGASFAEEVDIVMRSLMRKLEQIPNLNLTVIYHDGTDNKVHVLEPLSWLQSNGTKYSNPPKLNVDPNQFLTRFLQNYILAVLQYVFYGSLLCENIFRLRHLEDAVRRMEQRQCELKRKTNAVRQEEITEELEIIMLTRNRSATT